MSQFLAKAKTGADVPVSGYGTAGAKVFSAVITMNIKPPPDQAATGDCHVRHRIQQAR